MPKSQYTTNQELNKMTELLVKNSKIAKANNTELSVYNFGIPAFQSATGLKTCPMAGACAKGCYATQGSYSWTPVKAAYEWRLEQTLRADFVPTMIVTLRVKLKSAKRTGKQLVIRIHDSGDFYSLEYATKWLAIVTDLPEVKFYAYTKQVPMFKRLDIPSNLTIIYSEGGLADARINTDVDRHARVFGSAQELTAAGYSDASKDDMVAALGASNKIGLVFHGYKSTAWTTVPVPELNDNNKAS
jgi:hypothetical protein